jgi:deoxyribose-phosphate aldolase
LAARAEILLRPGATRAEVESFCAEARLRAVYGVAVPTSRVELALTFLEGSALKVVALVDFPFGAADSDVKRFETEVAVDLGAHEIQFMLHTPRLLDGETRLLLREMRDLAEAADERPVTVTLEPQLLSADQVRSLCEMALDSGIQGIANAVGVESGVTPEFVQGLRTLLGPKFLIKAGAPPLAPPTAQALLASGASRLQTGEQFLAALPQA